MRKPITNQLKAAAKIKMILMLRPFKREKGIVFMVSKIKVHSVKYIALSQFEIAHDSSRSSGALLITKMLILINFKF